MIVKKAKRPDKATSRMLPPLDNLTFEDWAAICDKVDAKYGDRESNVTPTDLDTDGRLM